MWKGYHRSTRANTPDSVSFRRFLLFSSWLAPASLQRNVARQHRREYADSASLRLKKQKSLENTSLPGAGSFAGAEMCPGKERPAENTAVLSRDLTRYGRISARQNRVCPCQSMVPSINRFALVNRWYRAEGVVPPPGMSLVKLLDEIRLRRQCARQLHQRPLEAAVVLDGWLVEHGGCPLRRTWLPAPFSFRS